MAAEVTVVVPTHNRAEMLPALIDSLLTQQRVEAEVVVVDDGSTDDTGAVLHCLGASPKPTLTTLRVSNGGPARARNLGWRAGSAPLVAFTDDDCVPSSTWLAELVEAARGGLDIVQGRTEALDTPGTSPTWFDRAPKVTKWSGRFESCNLLIRRTVLQELGGFDESFRQPMGEDTDLGLRAVDRGVRTGFAASAVVYHHVWKTGFRGFLRQRRRHAEVVRLVRHNPAARGILRWGYVVRPVHVGILALLPLTLVSAAVGRPWLALLPVVGWSARQTVRTRHRPFPMPIRFGFSLAQFVGYSYETACFVVASIRHRTIVI